nr:MAG TPA: hypothetical protein [Bacteriophage sp.]
MSSCCKLSTHIGYHSFYLIETLCAEYVFINVRIKYVSSNFF